MTERKREGAKNSRGLVLEHLFRDASKGEELLELGWDGHFGHRRARLGAIEAEMSHVL